MERIKMLLEKLDEEYSDGFEPWERTVLRWGFGFICFFIGLMIGGINVGK